VYKQLLGSLDTNILLHIQILLIQQLLKFIKHSHNHFMKNLQQSDFRPNIKIWSYTNGTN